MSAITDYASLQVAVAKWLHRTDLQNPLDAFVGDFIALAEGTMSADIKARPMDTRATITAAPPSAYVTLPTDMLEMRRIKLVTDPVYVLEYKSPDQLDEDNPSAMVGKPDSFTIIGNQVQLSPVPDTAYPIEVTYSQRIPSLSNTNTTNWLLLAFPNAYLYGALSAAQPYIMNDARLPVFKSMYKEAVDAINSIDWYSGTTMRVRAK